jgi:hypothetical protein
MTTTPEEETLASLTRVSHKLALTKDDRFASVVDKLLPKLLQRLGENHSSAYKEPIQKKLMEMLSHIMKRVKEDTGVPLPCETILQLFFLPTKEHETTKYQRNFEMHPMTLHFALAFLAVGVPRCTTNPFPLLPYLVACQTFFVGTKKSQSHSMAHLLLHCLSLCVTTTTPTTEQKEKYVQVTRELLQHNETLQATVFDLFLDVLLYPSSYSQTTLPPPGLSQAGHERLREQTVGAWQTAILEWIAPQRHALFVTDEPGRTRTLSLLIVSSPPAASTYLKQYMESNSEGLLGDPVRLCWTLLSLCLGQAQAESLLPTTNVSSLYLGRSQPDDPTPTPQLLLSIQRRPLTDPSTLLSFVTQSVFQNHPRLRNDMQPVVPLALQVIENILNNSVPSRGLSVLRAKSYIAAAEMLQMLAIRLAALEDWDPEQLVLWQRRILVVTCRILSPASSSLHVSTTTRQSVIDSEGNLAIRDACYGTISTLCRSSFALSAYVFGNGNTTTTTTSSVQTASMLFGCAAHEEEKLKPRAVAALDALLGSYIRLYSRPEESKTLVEASLNPWASTTSERNNKSSSNNSSSSADSSKLLGALLPLVWTAAQSYQPKASRVAAARWASELLQTLDRASACHVLCFLAGDDDPTVANLAREGLGLSATLEESEYDMAVEENESSSASKLPDFGRFVSFVFQDPSKQQRDSLFRSQHFEDFSLKGKAVTLHFGMRCLLNDFYGGSDESIRSYLEALTRSLILYKSGSMRIDSAHSLHAVDLLDVCSSSMAALVSASKFARECFMNGSFGFKELQELAVHVNSSRARRYLAKSCGIMLEDNETWEKEDSQLPVLQLESSFDLCLTILSDIEENRAGSLSRTHGSIFLGAYAIKALRKRISQNASLVLSSFIHKAATVLAKLGYGCMHSDELVGNACSDCIVIAFHCDDNFSVHLDTEFCQSSVTVMRKLAEANAKFSHTDGLNTLRALKCAAASGACLAATTYPQQDVDKDVLLVLHATRQTCVESLIGLLGSAAFRNEEEIAIGVGEALALYANSYSNAGETDTNNHSIKKWPDTYHEGIRLELSPAEDVLYVLLRKTLLSSSPQTRTSVAPALLAIIAMAAREVSKSAAFFFERDNQAYYLLTHHRLMATDLTTTIYSSGCSPFISTRSKPLLSIYYQIPSVNISPVKAAV